MVDNRKSAPTNGKRLPNAERPGNRLGKVKVNPRFANITSKDKPVLQIMVSIILLCEALGLTEEYITSVFHSNFGLANQIALEISIRQTK